MPFLAPDAAQGSGQNFNTVASALVRLYEDARRDAMANGGFMSVRTVPANDIPTLTSSATAPSADTDAATKFHSLCGRAAIISGAAEITLASEINSLASWVSGFNQGLRCRWYSDMYRLSTHGTSYIPDAGNGAQDNNLSPQMKIDNLGVYADIVLEGDVLFITATNSSRFVIWVNDRLITTAVSAAGTGLGVDASGQQYTPSTAGRQYFKLKFPTVDTRTIRIQHYGAGGIGDFYTRVTHNVYPRHKKKLNWLHISDTFGSANGALNQVQTAAFYLANSFGTSINFVNGSTTSTGFATNNATTSPNWLERWDTDLKLNKPMDVVTIFGSYSDGGKGALAANVAALIGKIKAAWPTCEVIVANTVTTTQISGGSDVTDENTILNAASAAGASVIQSQTDASGKWLTGTGREGSLANNGNADLYVTSAGTSPSNSGHAYWGRRWARGVYDAMRLKLGA